MKEILKIYTEVGSGTNDNLFRGGISISEYTYSSITFNVVKQLSATLYHNECLDDFWTNNEYVSFKGTRYYIRKVPTWTLEDTDTRYKYDVQFVSEAKILEDVYWYDTYTAGYATYYSESTKIMFMGDIQQFVARMNAALNKSIVGGGWNVVIADGITSEIKLVSMDKVYFADALKYMYDTFELPYYIVGKTIYVGLPTTVLPYTFEFGANKGLYGLTKTQANFRPINRITGIGSAENIPYYYPNLSPKREEVENWIEPQTNLMPPLFRQTNGVEKFYNAINDRYLLPDSTTEYYHFDNVFNSKAPSEHVQELNEIKPTIQGMTYNGLPIDVIKSVQYDVDDNDNIDIETGDVEHPYFKIILNPLGFDLFASASARGEMTIYMNTGNCGACSFRVMVDESKLLNGDYGDSTNNSVTLILEKDVSTYNTLLPNQQLKVKAGDKFVILYIDLPQSYITFAENKLYNGIIKHLSENNKERFNFQAKFDEKLLTLRPEIENQIAENTLIPIRYKSGGKNTDSTPIYREVNLNVQSITIKQEDAKPLPSYEIGLTDNVTISSNSVNKVNDKVDIADKEIASINKKTDEQARRNIKSLKDAEKYLFDPDGYIKEDRLSAKTIQALVGVFGTDSSAYYLNNVKLLTNIGGNANAIQFSTGALHHYLIKWGTEETNNNYVWNVAPPLSRTDLVSEENYYIYIQANRNNNSAIWYVSTEQIQYDSSDLVYYFLVGNLLPVENGYRSQTFQKGLTYINGGDIRTGTISSFSDNLTIDLDKGEIIGKVKFKVGSSGLTNLDEWDDVETDINNALTGVQNLAYLKEVIGEGDTSILGGGLFNNIVAVSDIGEGTDLFKIRAFVSGLKDDKVYFGANEIDAYNICSSFANNPNPNRPLNELPAWCVFDHPNGYIDVFIKNINLDLLTKAAIVHDHARQTLRPMDFVIPNNIPTTLLKGENGFFIRDSGFGGATPGGGGGGVSDYGELTNPPFINSVKLKPGNNTLAELGIASISHVHEISQITGLQQNLNNYLLKTGGELSGSLTITTPGEGLRVKRTDPYYPQIGFENSFGFLGEIGVLTVGVPAYYNPHNAEWSSFLHEQNYNLYAPSLTGYGATGQWNISVDTADMLRGVNIPDINTNYGHNLKLVSSWVPDPNPAVQNNRYAFGLWVGAFDSSYGLGIYSSAYENELFFRKYATVSWGKSFKIWHDGNSNKADANWTVSNLYLNGLLLSDNILSLYNIGGSPQGISAGSLLVSSNYIADTSNIPVNGIYSSGIIRSGASFNAPNYYASGWYRNYGATGFLNETFGGGIYMEDSTYVRVFGSKSFLVGNSLVINGLNSSTNAHIVLQNSAGGDQWAIKAGWQGHNENYLTIIDQYSQLDSNPVFRLFNTGLQIAGSIESSALIIPFGAPTSPESGKNYIFVRNT